MGAFWIGLATVLGYAAKPILFRILAALGIGIATFTGLSVVLGQLQSYMLGHFGGLPPFMLQALGMMNVDVFINMIISAYAFRLTYAQTVKWVRTTTN